MASITSLGVHGPSAISYLVAEGLLSEDHTQDQYFWTRTDAGTYDKDEEEELLTTDRCVVWSRGGVPRRTFRFDIEAQPVVQATIAWFPTTHDHEQECVPKAERPSSADPEKTPSSPDSKAAAPRPSGWSLRAQSYSSELYQPSRKEDQSKARPDGALRSRGLALSRALVVALRTQVHIYYFSGSSHVVHLPFEVDSILGASQGIIIRRRFLSPARPFPAAQSNPPNSFALSFGESWSVPHPLEPGSQGRLLVTPEKPNRSSQLSRADAPSVLLADTQDESPSLFSLLDPLMELGQVLTTEGQAIKGRPKASASIAGGGGGGGGGSRLSSDEEILYMSSPTELLPVTTAWNLNSGLALAVTLNRRTGVITIWKVRHAESRYLSSRIKRRASDSSNSRSRRQSSFAPSSGTGTSTPVPHAMSVAARESFGSGARDRAHLASSGLYSSGIFGPDDKQLNDNNQLASALDVDPENDLLSTKQSRRVSSLLARADLAANQSKLPYSDLSAGNAVPSKSSHHMHTRRSDSFAYQTRRSIIGPDRSSFRASLRSFSTTASSEAGTVHGDTMEDAVEDGHRPARRETTVRRANGEIGSTGAVTLEKVGSISTERAQHGHRPVGSLVEPKAFALVPPQSASVDQQSDSVIVICVVDTQSERLLCLDLGIEARRPSTSQMRAARRRSPPGSELASKRVLVKLLGVRHENKMVDAIKLVEKDFSRALALQRAEDGMNLCILPGPGCDWLRVPLPQQLRPIDSRRLGLPVPWLTRDKLDQGHVLLSPSPALTALMPVFTQGMVGLVDQTRRTHLVQIHMRPRHHQVATILELCSWILPDHNAGEGLTVAWWEVMRWLDTRPMDILGREWTALIITLMSMAVPFLDGPRRSYPSRGNRHSVKSRKTSGGSSHTVDYWSEMFRLESEDASNPRWITAPAWDWCLTLEREANEMPIESPPHQTRRASDLARAGPPIMQSASAWSKNPLLLDCTSLAREFVSSGPGSKAMAEQGYLPTAKGRNKELQRTALPTIVVALHLYREELKLNISSAEADEVGMGRLTAVLAQLGSWLGWDSWSWRETGYYSTEDVHMQRWLFDEATITGLEVPPQQFEPPSIYQWVEGCLSGDGRQPFLTLADLFSGSKMHIDLDDDETQSGAEAYWKKFTPRTTKVIELFKGLTSRSGSPTEVVERMVEVGIDKQLLETLPEGLATPLRDAVAACQSNPPTTWGPEILGLIGREDLKSLLAPDPEKKPATTSQAAQTHEALRDVHGICNTAFETEAIGAFDGVAEVDRHAITRLIFREDRRFAEASKLVQSAKASVVRCLPEPDWSETDLLDAQKDLVQTVAIRTLAVPSGRGLLYLSARLPLLTERFPIPGFNLSCVMKPSNTTVSADKSAFTEEKVGWAFFHAGVAAGLSISRDAKGIDTSWIMFNKPAELSNRHAGFLLALGLNGHLKSIAKWMAFKYLTPKHTMTSIGLLLGLSASYLGTMDPLITRLLSVHITCMLPHGAAELNLSPLTQTTGLMATGLLYCNTQHRRMSEVMLSEMEQIDYEDASAPIDTLRDEGYRLAAGFALGYINLGKGNDLRGLHDMNIIPRLLNLAVGSKKANIVHVLDKSMAGATVAIALIFMKSHDGPLARKIDIPSAKPQFDYIRPDIFLLRTVAKHLIMWDGITPKPAWIRANLPPEHRDKMKLKNVHSLTSEDLPFLNIIAGLCFSMGLRFAGSGATEVRDVLGFYLDQFIRLCRLPAMNYDQKLTRSTVRNCQDVVALSAATVMAGTGDIHVFRRLRSLHGRTDADTPYGSHFAAHMAIGVLFLGGGTHTFGTSDLAVASLLCAFHPLFPTSILDNKSHLQAFRHLCVLAAEPRCIVARDADTYRPVSIPLHLTLRDGSERRGMAPCLLPELPQVATVSTASSEHWRVVLDFTQNPSHVAAFKKNQSIYVRERAAHYTSDSTSIFHATLQALNEMETLAATCSFSSSPRHRFDWLLSLPSFDIFDKAERTLLLRSNGTGNGMGGGGGSSGGLGATHSAVQDASTMETTLIDARLMLEIACLDADRADRLRNLRLLFAYADRAEREGVPLRWIKREVVDRLRAAVWMILMQEHVPTS